MSRDVATLDEFVSALVIERLSRDDYVDLFAVPTPEVDLGALRAGARTLRIRKGDLAEAFAVGEIDRAQLVTGTRRIDAQLTAVEHELAAASSVSPIAPLGWRSPV